MISEEKKLEYQKYITSHEWYNLKIDLLKIRGCKCEKCGAKRRSTGLHIHHLNYDRLFNERAEDLLVLCPICHMKEHGIIKVKVRKKRPVKKTKRQKKSLKLYQEKLKRIDKGYKAGVYKTFAAYMRAKTKAGIN